MSWELLRQRSRGFAYALERAEYTRGDVRPQKPDVPEIDVEQRVVGLGPEHDWSSHCADAFGLMAIAYEEPSRLAAFSRELKYANPDTV